LQGAKEGGRDGYRERVEKERGIEMESERKRNTHNLGGKHQ
jgi:hypothetical protein